ncbi:MAG: tetratricopeptide repeat protein [Pyrinomonadaceae bacterium]
MLIKGVAIVLFCLAVSISASAQVDEICKEFGYMATLDAPRLTAPFVYGRIAILSNQSNAKFPKVTVTYANRSQSPSRVTVDRSGSYCFKITSGNGGTLTIDINGVEVARRDVPDFGPSQKREDFQVAVPGSPPAHTSPSVISSKFNYPTNEKTTGHYKKAVALEKEKNLKAAIAEMRNVVEIDANDFIAWAYLGNLQFENDQLQEADTSYRQSLALSEDYTPVWVNVGKLRVAQKQPEAAIEIFKHAAALEPEDARTFRLLGETYLTTKQGTLGAQALNHAIRLDPIGQAECHLQLAHLFQLAGAKDLAVKEYQKFLEKVPDHAERKKYEKFISDNKPKT